MRGRSDELRALDKALAGSLEGAGRAVVVRGRAGTGKSTLLRRTADRAAASGWRVLRLSGADDGHASASPALAALARPVLDQHDCLPGALRAVLRWSVADGACPQNGLLTYAALRQGLVSLARQRPLLVTADDCRWMDQSALGALTYLSNRLAGTRMALVCAADADAPGTGHEPGPFTDWEATRVRLAGLDEDSARLLLTDHHPRLTPSVRAAVLHTAEGNPRALIDLPKALTPDQREGRAALPDPLPAGPALTADLGPRFRELPDDTRALLAALATGNDASTAAGVAWLAEHVEEYPEALGPAEAAGLVTGDHRPRFTSRVHRCLAYSTASASARSRAQDLWMAYEDARSSGAAGALEEAFADGDRLDRLDALARTALAKGAWISAVRSLRQAADLCTRPGERARRLAAAAATAARCGQPGLALALVGDVDTDGDATLARTVALVRACAGFDSGADRPLLTGGGSSPLADALVSGPVLGVDGRDWAVFRLATVSMLTRRPEPVRAAWRWLEDRGATGGALGLAVSAHLDPMGRLASIRRGLRGVSETMAREPDSFGLQELVWLAEAASRIEDGALAVQLASAALRRADENGRAELHHCRALRAEHLMAVGLWAELADTVPGWIQEADDEGLTRHGIALRSHLLLISVFQGKRAEAEALMDVIGRWARAQGSVHHQEVVEYAAFLLARGEGRAAGGAEALPLLSAAGPARSGVARRAYVEVLRAALDRGDLRAAHAWVAEAERVDVGSLSPGAMLLVRHGRAVLAAHQDADDAPELFRAAHESAMASPRLLDRAGFALDYGSWLRRRRETAAARSQLRYAYDEFARLQAVPWWHRARLELRAIGESVRTQPEAATAPEAFSLSAHEWRVARFAADGLSNREIAEQLRISPRTVASHLYKMFPRLGISSRRELGPALREAGRAHR
ncbi:AAA family ATPase [Streptomyces sp. VRA16 Mangrove soil]|uniref:AAA family ATPase n=1 Tax=Streptomyces sp. VRA16 Mangrove soil TaxID=2817434 RepID=UPI001A9F5322|nr:LuxR family transcriptional regulator [Streptomyces sp. VRA16 Mangrove soil]MBO1331226.1 AAA family ATPase [Streptomyces sp. VRA16 Mangrove soil]